MVLRYVIFFVVALLLMGGVHYYLWARLVRDVAIPKPWSAVITTSGVALFVLLMAGFAAARGLPRSVASPMAWVAFTWLGIVFYLFLTTLFGDALKGITRWAPSGALADPERRQAVTRGIGLAMAALGLGASGAALASGLSRVAVTRLRVKLDKLGKDAQGYRIVQLTDVHVGPTIGKAFIEEIVQTANDLSPDMIVITGDLVDGSVAELTEHVAPLARLSAKDGVYFVTGNHEYYSGADEWIAHLGALGVRVLRNECVNVRGPGGFDLAGIDDHSSRSYGRGHGPDLERALANRDPARACVLLAHQPRGVEIAERMGVDLQLSGHTHGGQLFPWGFLVRLQQPFVAGLHRLARTQIFVSRGTGYWGPPMRLGSPAEIVELELVSS